MFRNKNKFKLNLKFSSQPLWNSNACSLSDITKTFAPTTHLKTFSFTTLWTLVSCKKRKSSLLTSWLNYLDNTLKRNPQLNPPKTKQRCKSISRTSSDTTRCQAESSTKNTQTLLKPYSKFARTWSTSRCSYKPWKRRECKPWPRNPSKGR